MFNPFYTRFADSQRSELLQYCKMEHVLPESLVCAGKPKSTLKLQLATTAFHLLQRIEKRLHALIGRLTADLEHNGRVQRYQS